MRSRRSQQRRQGIRDSATDEDAYPQLILAKWQDVEGSVTRTAGFMLLVAAIFELINRREASELNLSFIKLTDPSLVLVALPVVIAYLYSTFGQLVAEGEQALQAYVKAVSARQDANKSYEALVPGPSLIAALRGRPAEGDRRTQRIAYGGNVAKVFIAATWPIVFQVYAYDQLFRVEGPSSALLWLSAAVAALLMAFGVVSAFAKPMPLMRRETDSKSTATDPPDEHT
jgi:hypothetical protein